MRILLAAAVVLLPSTLQAQIRVHPTGVNVNAQGATTVFLTFGGLGGYTAADAAWCGELVPAEPDMGMKAFETVADLDGAGHGFGASG